MKRATELIMNSDAIIIVPLCRTFSGHLLVVGPADPLILVRLRVTFLFWIRTIAMSSIQIIICIFNKIVYMINALKVKTKRLY